jgi:transposase
MSWYTIQHKFSCGMDRHVDWMYLGVSDADGEVRLHQKIRPEPQTFLLAGQPCRDDVVVCVECLLTRYGLADLCAAEGLPLVLGHALDMRAIHGGTAQHDRLDAHKIAALLRGGLIPQADVDPRRMRAPRDRLRRRHHLRHTRAEWFAPIQHTASQDHLGEPVGRMATPQNRRGLLERCAHGCVPQTMALDLALVDCDAPLRAEVEPSRETTARGHAPVALARWRPIPGVGTILALVLRYEIEEITRFPRVQAFVSDCRLVQSARASHGKRHGPSGKKIGNAQRPWAVSEAAGLLRKTTEPAQKSLAKLATRPGTGKALASRAHTRGRAVDQRLKPHVAFDQAKFRAA